MRKILFSFLLFAAVAVHAQSQEKTPAQKGVMYGAVSDEDRSIAPDDLSGKLVNNEYTGQVKGKVVDVCRAEGCWMTIEKNDGTALMVRTKAHAFLLPENIVGKTVLIEGSASVKEVSEQMRKHYAQDAGKTKEEIAKIEGPEKQVEFVAKGVLVLD